MLAFGILLLPLLFLWLVFQKGYSRRAKVLAAVLGLVGVVCWAYALDRDGRQAAAERVAQRAAERNTNRPQEQKADLARKVRTATCGGDIDCAAGRTQLKASLLCKRSLERMARFDHRWSDGWTESKLPRARWSERFDIVREYGPGRIIEYQGNALQLQNEFGAWRTVSYECDFDPVTEQLIHTRLSD